jgi:aldehyde dehydrogenase (NAD+)
MAFRGFCEAQINRQSIPQSSISVLYGSELKPDYSWSINWWLAIKFLFKPCQFLLITMPLALSLRATRPSTLRPLSATLSRSFSVASVHRQATVVPGIQHRPLKYTSTEEIDKIHERLTKTFDSGVTLPLAYRRKQLLALARLAQENSEAIIEAVYADLGRPRLEVSLPEIGPIVSGSLLAAEKLEEWARPEKPEVESWRSSWDTTIYKVPKGVVAVLGAWNYPIIIALAPLIGAIASGSTCVLKPSELSPATAQLLADLFPRYLDPNAYAVVNGAAEETNRILELQWNHIFYTGSTRVGKIVGVAAAKQVTPVTLELGGKSPVYFDTDNTDIELAAKRTLWGKQQCAGQVCVAPDFLLVPRKDQDKVVEAFKKAYASFYPYPKGAIDPASPYGRIVNPIQHHRVATLLRESKGEIALGGGIDGDKRIEPTIVKNVTMDDSLMQEEIFGPILPIVPVDNMDEAISLLNKRPVPLVAYVFTDSEKTKEAFIERTRSGTIVLNDTFQHLAVHEIPFGGQGQSGYGQYFGRYSFDAFTHRRGHVNVPPAAESALALRYPPYTEEAYNTLSTWQNEKIPNA